MTLPRKRLYTDVYNLEKRKGKSLDVESGTMKENPWHKFCRDYQKKHSVSYAAAISLAGKEWKEYKEKNGLEFRKRSSTVGKQETKEQYGGNTQKEDHSMSEESEEGEEERRKASPPPPKMKMKAREKSGNHLPPPRGKDFGKRMREEVDEDEDSSPRSQAEINYEKYKGTKNYPTHFPAEEHLREKGRREHNRKQPNPKKRKMEKDDSPIRAPPNYKEKKEEREHYRGGKSYYDYEDEERTYQRDEERRVERLSGRL